MVINFCVECFLISKIDYSMRHCDKNPYSRSAGFINLHLSDYIMCQYYLHYYSLTEVLLPTLTCPIFNNTASITLSPIIITANNSGYTAIVAIHCVDIATGSDIL